MMTFKRVSPVCLILCLAAVANTASAQTPSSAGYSVDTTGFATAGDFSGSYLFGNDGGTYFLFDKLVGDGPGFSAGYSRLGMRVKLIDTGHSHLWGSGYALITDENRVGVNLGGGVRWLVDSNIISLHGWFDSYATDNGNRYEQIAAGIELLHEEVDLRVNGYLPFGEEENFLGVTDPGSVSVFTNRGIGFLGRGLDEQALKGIDAEVGTAIFAVNWARVYAGGYFYESKDSDFGGVRGRIETAISPDLSLNFMVQNDSMFDTNYNVQVEFRFSGGLSPGFFTPFHGETRKYNPVRRQWPIATKVVEIPTTVPLLNFKTGEAVVAAFIDPRNPAPGDGSLGNPFSFLPDSVDADKIFVFTGDSSIGNPIAGNIALMPHQQLLGEGKLYTFDDQLRGTITVPDVFSSTGPRPVLTAANPAENVVTLSKGNRVANFDIIGPAAAAIGGMNITGFEIDMVRTAGVTDGVNIMNASGRGIIRDSGFSAMDQGIFVSNTNGDQLVLSIERGATSPGIVIPTTALGSTQGIHVAADGADVILDLTDVVVNNVSDTGITLASSLGGHLSADVNNTHVLNGNGSAGTGFELNVASGGSMSVNMMDISADGTDDLFVVDVRDGTFNGVVGGGIPGVLPGAAFEAGGGSGVRLYLEDALGTLRFDNLAANGNAVHGIETFATGDGTDFFVEVTDSQLFGNTGSGFLTEIIDGADFRYFIDPTFVMQSGASGFEFDVRGPGSVFIADIIQTTFAESGVHAISGNVFNGASANVDVIQTPGTNAGVHGFNLNVERNAQFVGTIDQSDFSFAGDTAVNLAVSEGASLFLTASNIDGHDNGSTGLNFLAEDGGLQPTELFLSVTDGDFNSNIDSNIVGTSSGAGTRASVYLNQVTADALAANGSVILNADSGGVLNTTWNGGSVSQSLANGITANVDGAGSQVRLNLNGLVVGTNAGDGINGTLTNGGPGSVLDMTLVGTSVSDNTLSGVVLTSTGPGALSRVTFDNSRIAGNFFGDGFRFDISGGAGLLASATGAATAFSGNGGQGWEGVVDEAGSFATLAADGTSSDFNGLEGGRFEVTGGGLLNLDLANLSISQNALDGLFTSVDGAGSRANIFMDQVTMFRNGLSLLGDGFEARASGGGLVDATLTNMSITDNREDALHFDASTMGTIRLRADNIMGGNNGRHGLEFHVSSGGGFDGLVTASDFSNEGSVFVGNGVFGTATDAGTTAMISLQGVTADNNTRMGFEFDVSGGATLLADIQSSGFGDSSGSGNAINGVRFNATGAGTMGFLKMMGPNTFDDNAGGDGVNYDAVGVNMAVAQVSADSISNNGGDGINIRMIDVDSGAIALQGLGTATITGNVGDGIDITTQNVVLQEKTVNGMTIPGLLIDGFIINNNGGDPIILDTTNTTIVDGMITNNDVDGGLDGISVHLGGGDADLLIDGNTVANAARYGIVVTSDAGTHNVTISNNSVTSSGDTNIFTDLFGTTETGLMINDNSVIGGGLGTPTFTVGTNFTGMTFTQSLALGTASIPPDTMGSVGPDHIVEFVNQGVTIFNKDGTVAVPTISLDQFWINAGLPDTGDGTFDPRIIFDPTVNRWFVASIDSVSAGGNSIYLGVSLTADPTQGFTGFRFVGDSVDDMRFNDFDTLGLDADGVYIATNNFGGPNGFDVSVYSIPKADLLSPLPTIVNLSRFEGLDSTMFGESIQPAVDFGPSDGLAQFVGSLFPGGASVQRVDVVGADTPTAAIGVPVPVPTPFYQISPGGRQPNPFLFPLEPPSPRFHSNIIEVGDSLWAVQDVQGTSLNNGAVRWYEIDAVTNTVLQTGLIEDPNLDFVAASINVNASGAVMIGFTGSGPGQFASSMAAFGATDAMGVTTFQTPTVLQAGVANYELLDGLGRNRWGDYSATVLDPVDPNTFWTFQELVVGPNNYGVQITEVQFNQPVLGGTVNDGIRVEVRENAHLTDSTINGNSSTNNGDDGIEVSISDMAIMDDLTINGNNATDNGGDGIVFVNNSTGTMGDLSISGNMDVSDNSQNGIFVELNGVGGEPDIMVNSNIVANNIGMGIFVDAVDTAVGDISISMNDVTDNTAGDGIFLDLGNTNPGALAAGDIVMIGNSVSGSTQNGIAVNLENRTGINLLNISMSNINNNMQGGIVVNATDTAVDTMLFDFNSIVNNTGGDGLRLNLTDSPVDTLTVSQSTISTNTGDGVNLNLDGSAINTLNIVDNTSGGTFAGLGLMFLIDGNTFGTPFSISNTSSAGNDIVSFQLDISTAIPNPLGGLIFDTEATGAPIAFQPQFMTDILTGLQTVNGNTITPGTNPLQDGMGMVLPGGGVPDNTQLLDLTYNDFNPTEVFQWLIDLDFSTAPGSTVLGSDLVGSTIRVDFIGGEFLTGALMPIPGDFDASTFVATGGTPTGAPGISGNLGNGVQINAANGSDIGALNVDNNIIDSNLGHGVEFLVNGSTLPAVGGTSNVSNNDISENGMDGFRIINPDTGGTPFQMDFVDNTIDNNGTMGPGVGINVEVNTNSGGMTSTITGNSVSGNSSIGMSFVANDDAHLDLTIGDSMTNANIVDGNVDAGIAIKTKDNSTAEIVVENTMVINTADGPNAAFNGDGLAVHSSGNSTVTSMTVGDDTLVNTTFSANAGNGIDIELSESARNPNILIQNVLANGNGDNGIGISRFGFSSFTEDLDSDNVIDAGEDVNMDGMLGHAVITMTTANGNAGNGLDVFVTGSGLPVQMIDVMLSQNSFSNNTIGMNFLVENDATLVANAANNVVDNNSSHGVQVITNQNGSFGNVIPSGGDAFSPMAVPSVFSSMVVTNNGGNGFNFIANDNSVQVIDVDDSGAVNPSTGTSATVVDGNAGNQVQITGNDNSQQNIDLVGVRMTNVNGVATGDGVNIDANDMSTVDVEISGGVAGQTVIGASIAHVSVPGLGAGGGVSNGITGIVEDDAILNLAVSDLSIFNNTGDGIFLRNTGPNTTGNQAGGSGERQTIQATFNNVDVRLNGDQGLDVILDGNIGGRASQFDADVPVLIDIQNSTFSSNINEGIFFSADPNVGHAGNQFYHDMIVTFNLLNSFVQSNGSASITDGLVMNIGTNAYVLADISNTMFGANGLDDFNTSSFLSGLGATTAAMDLRFQGNSGDHIRPRAFGPGTSAANAFFILDNAFTVEPNNNFQMFGVPQMEVIGPDGFGTNGYILRPGSNHGDPTFPP